MLAFATLRQKIQALAAASRAEIDAMDRPDDAVPIDLVLPIFFVHPDHRDDWQPHVPAEVWQRIHRLMGVYDVIIDGEAAIQRTPFALSHAELSEFRERPLLRMASLVNIWLDHRRGGRTKRDIEIALREALEFEVFRRDPEIGTLFSCMQARFDGVEIAVTKGAGLNELVRLAWVPDVPTKGDAADQGLSEADRRLALFNTLRSEGEKLAVARLPGLACPADAEAAVITQIRALAQHPWSRADFEAAITRAAGWVKILMKSCAHATTVAEKKHQLSKQAKKQLQRRRAPKGNDPFAGEPATKQQIALFGHGDFSALELAFIAVAADVDPNLVSTNHALATPEFRIARKLGRMGRNHHTPLDIEEINDLQHLILGEAGHADTAMFQDVHRYLAECALELLPLDEWKRRLKDALANNTRVVFPD